MSNRSHSSRSGVAGLDPAVLRATDGGTRDFRRRFADRCAPDFFRETTFGLAVGSVGIGSYLGESTDEADRAYEAAVQHAVASGVNLIDTAINYRCQRSERAIGAAIQQIIGSGSAAREALVVCTKGGYVPLEREAPPTREAYQAYLRREFFEPEILHPDDLVAGGHSLAPRFLRYCLAKSRQNLGLRTIDVYYLHNPGQQLAAVAHATWLKRMSAAVELLEEAASRSEIGVYGIATWDELRTEPGRAGHVNLEDLVALARSVGGEGHRFRAVQLPINLAMSEAARLSTQSVGGRTMTVLDAAQALGLTVFASAPLMQGRLTTGLPETLAASFPRCRSDAQRALEFVRGLPGVTAALTGTKRREHVDENLAPARV